MKRGASPPDAPTLLLSATMAICWLTTTACHRLTEAQAGPTTTQTDRNSDAPAEGSEEGVRLTPEEVAKMGIMTVAAKAVLHAPESTGFGVVIAHESIAQAVADLAAALAVEHQSRSALERARHLAGTPGAMPADVQETAARQALVDRSALELAQRRLSAMFGQKPPWGTHPGGKQLSALANGDTKLVRVTFPLDSLATAVPATLRLARINASQGGKSFTASPVWSAPADATVPGASYFTFLHSSDVGEGERLLAWAANGEPQSGVEVPAAAAVISAGKYWCYIETKAGTFVRTEIDPDLSTAEGYFVKDGVAAGDKVVVIAAGQLLARETNPSTAAD